VLIDLTERRKNEHAVAEAREFSDAIIQTIHEPLLVLESGLRIIRINEAFRKMFQLPLRAARGLSLSSVLNLWRSGNELRQRLEQALIDNVALSDFEFEVFPRKLGRRIFRFNARPLFQEQPARTPAPLLLVALEDITARKQAEEELAESNKQLQQLNDELERRVEERTHQLSESNKQLESFCYSIAHDLRGPLRAVAGFGAALMDDFASKLGEQGADYANRIVHAAQQMDELIRDLLEYGRFNTINLAPAPVDAEEVLSHVLDNLQTSIQEKHARIERKGRLPTVMGHRVVLEAAFSNLLSNGLKFVPPGNTPEVTIWPEEQEREVRIWFADNGIGIDPQHQKRIFEVFQRLHSQKVYPGTGIGLAIVQTAVQRIGGQVGVESEPGKGSRFWVSLPKPGPRSAQAA
jgi:PAS domain S-box-containing protein